MRKVVSGEFNSSVVCLIGLVQIMTQVGNSQIVQINFDYTIVGDETAVRLQQDAIRGRTLLKRTSEDMVELGHILLNGKATLPHGQFTPWSKAEFNISQSTAWRFMQIAQGKEIKSPKSFIVNDLEMQQLAEATESRIQDTQATEDWREGLDSQTIARLEEKAKEIKVLCKEEARNTIILGQILRELQSRLSPTEFFEQQYRDHRFTPEDIAIHIGLASRYEHAPIDDLPMSVIQQINEPGLAILLREENIAFFKQKFQAAIKGDE